MTLSHDQKPLISLGMPVFNGEQYLQESLNAILQQTFSDFELIISDNASTDRTEEICRQYASQDPRIQYYRQKENLGGAGNFNFVFEKAKGKYFKWVAYDDLCASEYLEKCLKVLETNPTVVVCYPQAKEIDSEGNQLGKYTENLNILASKPQERFYQLLETYGFYHATQIFGLIRHHALKTTELLGKYPHGDRVLLSALAIRGEFVEVPETLFFRRVHPENSQSQNKSNEDLALKWFKGGIFLPTARRYWEYCRVVNYSPISGGEKFACYVNILRRFWLSPGLIFRFKWLIVELQKLPKIFLITQKNKKKSKAL